MKWVGSEHEKGLRSDPVPSSSMTMVTSSTTTRRSPVVTHSWRCAYQEVREDRLRWIEHTATRYDIDGVDMNFFSMPWVFKRGEEEKNMPLMTESCQATRLTV